MFTGNTSGDVARIFAMAQRRLRFGEQTEPEDEPAHAAPIVHRDVKPSNIDKRRIVAAKGVIP